MRRRTCATWKSLRCLAGWAKRTWRSSCPGEWGLQLDDSWPFMCVYMYISTCEHEAVALTKCFPRLTFFLFQLQRKNLKAVSDFDRLQFNPWPLRGREYIVTSTSDTQCRVVRQFLCASQRSLSHPHSHTSTSDLSLVQVCCLWWTMFTNTVTIK